MAQTQTIDQIVISSNGKNRSGGIAKAGQLHFPCLIGFGGIGQKRREGDGITPAGCWQMSYFLYRGDQISKPRSNLAGFQILPNDSWCDVTGSSHYNQPLAFTLPRSSEALWRPDNLYDIIIVIDHNTQPAVSGRGSAIFIHLLEQSSKNTHGCMAFRKSDLMKILQISGPGTRVLISP